MIILKYALIVGNLFLKNMILLSGMKIIYR